MTERDETIYGFQFIVKKLTRHFLTVNDPNKQPDEPALHIPVEWFLGPEDALLAEPRFRVHAGDAATVRIGIPAWVAAELGIPMDSSLGLWETVKDLPF